MLITTVAELQKFVPNINSNFLFKRIEQTLIRVEQQHIKGLIGTNLYNELLGYLSASGSGSGSGAGMGNPFYDQLITTLQDALANIATHAAYHLFTIKIGDSKAYRDVTEETEVPYQYQERDLKNALITNGFNAKENALIYLEENAGEFPDWVSSPQYTVHKSHFIQTAIAFTTEYSMVDNSRLVYVSLLPDMRLIEEYEIQSNLGEPYYADLKAKLKGNTLDANDEKVVALIKTCVAHLTIAEGLLKLLSKFQNTGVFFHEFDNGRTETVNENYINKLTLSAKKKGDQTLKNLREYLQLNADTYTLYKNGPAYKPEGVGHKIKTGKIARF